jgi:hypothetical protein
MSLPSRGPARSDLECRRSNTLTLALDPNC